MQDSLLIEFIHRKKGFFVKDNLFPVQTKVFEYGFKITNIGNNALVNLNITNIFFKSDTKQDMVMTVNKTFIVDLINPKEEKVLWIEKIGTYMQGSVSVHFDINSNDNTYIIDTYQKNFFTGNIDKTSTNNSWIDFIFIESLTEYNQKASNFMVLFLSFLSVGMICINFYYFYSYQVIPGINEQEKNNLEAKQRCELNPEGEVLMTNGEKLECSKFLEMLK